MEGIKSEKSKRLNWSRSHGSQYTNFHFFFFLIYFIPFQVQIVYVSHCFNYFVFFNSISYTLLTWSCNKLYIVLVVWLIYLCSVFISLDKIQRKVIGTKKMGLRLVNLLGENILQIFYLFHKHNILTSQRMRMKNINYNNEIPRLGKQ